MITQSATAIFNTYTGQVSLNAYTASFSSSDSAYYLISSRQGCTLNSRSTWAVPGRVEMQIGHSGLSMMIHASVTVYQSGEFNFKYSQAW